MVSDLFAELRYSSEPPHASIRVEEARAPSDLLARCAQMHDADKVAERRKKLFAGLGIGGLVIAFFTFFAGGISEFIPLFYVAGAFAVATAVAFVLWGLLGRADVDDRKLDVPRHLLDVLQPELHTKRPVKLWLDFASYEKTKALEDSTSMFNKTGTMRYVKPWLRMTLTLLDGSEVAVHARSSCKRKQRQKRKYTKKKDTVVDEVSVYVKPPKGVALDPAAGGRARAALDGGRAAQLRDVKVKPRMLAATFRCGPGRRAYGRRGWTAHGLESLLDGRRALALVLVAVGAMRAAQVR